MKKGIVLAGGSGSRLQPLTRVVCKQLLPVYDKPMIYYPLSTLMLLGIDEILIITTPQDLPLMQATLGDGSTLGIRLSYAVQGAPKGIAEAFVIGADFIAGDPVCLILGDNILHSAALGETFKAPCALKARDGAWIVGIPTSTPEKFGIIEADAAGQILSLEEKPRSPKSSMAAIGLYFYDSRVVEYARALTPSPRGELEITDLNNRYLSEGALRATFFTRGSTWLDAGECDSLMDAAHFVQVIEKRLGLKIGCIEEVAYNMGRISEAALMALGDTYGKSAYGQYLRLVASGA